MTAVHRGVLSLAILAGLGAERAFAQACDMFVGDTTEVIVVAPLTVAPPGGKDFFAFNTPTLDREEAEEYEVTGTQLRAAFCLNDDEPKSQRAFRVGRFQTSLPIGKMTPSRGRTGRRQVVVTLATPIPVNWIAPVLATLGSARKDPQVITLEFASPGSAVAIRGLQLQLSAIETVCRGLVEPPPNLLRLPVTVDVVLPGASAPAAASGTFQPPYRCGTALLEVNLDAASMRTGRRLTIAVPRQVTADAAAFKRALAACTGKTSPFDGSQCSWLLESGKSPRLTIGNWNRLGISVPGSAVFPSSFMAMLE